jgi:hypothetical protein
MMAAQVTHWLDRLDQACEKSATTSVHILIDQAGCDASLLPSVLSVEPPLRWHSLYTGLPEEGLEDIAPLLVLVDLARPLQRQWLIGVMNHLHGRSLMLTLASHWPFQVLAQHLTRCVNARNDGQRGLLRFYDPRLFPLLFSHVLEPEQQKVFLQPVEFWSWLDHDGIPQMLMGEAESPECGDSFRGLDLSDTQLNTLCCASEAKAFVARYCAVLPGFWGEEQRFQACYAAMVEATRLGLLTQYDRETYTLDSVLNA